MARLRARKVAGVGKKLIKAVTARTSQAQHASVLGIPPSHKRPSVARRVASHKSARHNGPGGASSLKGVRSGGLVDTIRRQSRVHATKRAVKSQYGLAHGKIGIGGRDRKTGMSATIRSAVASRLRDQRKASPGLKGRKSIAGLNAKLNPLAFDSKTMKPVSSLEGKRGRLIRISRHGGKTKMRQVGTFGVKKVRSKGLANNLRATKRNLGGSDSLRRSVRASQLGMATRFAHKVPYKRKRLEDMWDL